MHGFTRALRDDLLGKPIRITTLAPGLVETDFSLVRFRGDEEKAGAVYEDVALGGPIHAEDVADCIMFALTRPPHVNVDEIVVMALAQSSGARILRDDAMLTILEGSTFCICDDIGDVGEATSGFFTQDTRFLSRLCLRSTAPAAAALGGQGRVLLGGVLPPQPARRRTAPDQLSITRERFVGEAMQDVVMIDNHSMDPVSFELGLEFAADFADILSVKQHDFALGDPETATPLPPPVPPRYDRVQMQLSQEPASTAPCELPWHSWST